MFCEKNCVAKLIQVDFLHCFRCRAIPSRQNRRTSCGMPIPAGQENFSRLLQFAATRIIFLKFYFFQPVTWCHCNVSLLVRLACDSRESPGPATQRLHTPAASDRSDSLFRLLAVPDTRSHRKKRRRGLEMELPAILCRQRNLVSGYSGSPSGALGPQSAGLRIDETLRHLLVGLLHLSPVDGAGLRDTRLLDCGHSCPNKLLKG